MADSEEKGSFIHSPRRITANQFGLEEVKLRKEFRERLMSHLFSASFLVFLIVLVMVGAGVAMLFGGRTFSEVSDYWKWIIPLATTYIGYAIGKSPKSED